MRRFLFFWLVVGCAPEAPPKAAPRESQSYEQAIRTICDVDQHAGADPDDVLDVSAKREEYLLEHVKNSDGIYFLTLFRVNGPKEQAAMLDKEVASTKISACPLLAALRQESDPVPTPDG